jgi:Flp pilus assembly protein TadB
MCGWGGAREGVSCVLHPAAAFLGGAGTAPPTKLQSTMAQTRRKRRTKHRGTAAGTIQTRGRTGRPPSAEDRKKQTRTDARERRLNTPPTWKGAATRGALAAGLLFVLFAFLGRGKDPVVSAAIFAVIALGLYIPGGYYMETWMYNRRQKRRQSATRPPRK